MTKSELKQLIREVVEEFKLEAKSNSTTKPALYGAHEDALKALKAAYDEADHAYGKAIDGEEDGRVYDKANAVRDAAFRKARSDYEKAVAPIARAHGDYLKTKNSTTKPALYGAHKDALKALKAAYDEADHAYGKAIDGEENGRVYDKANAVRDAAFRKARSDYEKAVAPIARAHGDYLKTK